MNKLACLVIALALGCGGKSEEKPAEKPPEPEKAESGGMLGGLADKAKSLGEDVADKAKELGAEAVEKAGGVGDDVIAKAKEVAQKAGELSSDALAKGQALKDAAKDKVKLATSDFAVDVVSEEQEDFERRVKRMKRVKVGEYTVAWEQDAKHPLGAAYKWQFRVTWHIPLTKQAVRLSMFTNEELPELDLVNALVTIVPLAEKLVLP